MNNYYDMERPLYTLTIGEFTDLMSQFYSNVTKSDQQPGYPNSTKHLYYGLRGVQELFGCSHKQAQYYKDNVIQEAVSQNGRKIVVDGDLALKLFNQRRNKNVR